MVETSIKLNLEHGLHMRPASIFVQEASKYKSKITIFNGDQMADGKSIMGILTLSLSRGTIMKIVADGPDENLALEHLKSIVINTLV